MLKKLTARVIGLRDALILSTGIVVLGLAAWLGGPETAGANSMYALPAVTINGNSAQQMTNSNARAYQMSFQLDPAASGDAYVGRSDVNSNKAFARLVPGASYTITTQHIYVNEYYAISTTNTNDKVFPSYIAEP